MSLMGSRVAMLRMGAGRGLLLSGLLLCFVGSARSQNSGPGAAILLPDGPGKAIVQSACTVCHDLERVTRPTGATREEWQDSINYMVSQGAKLTKEQVAIVVDYLSKNYPDRSPKPVVVPGPVEVSIKEWTVPTPGSHPHDPLVAPDGSIWYTGNGKDLLGRFDPKTNKFKEYHVKPKSGPHGLVADKEGNIWFTAIAGGYIGKLDPQTGEVKEFPTPDAKVISFHTPLFDPKGNIWFTMSGNNRVGRLDPKTGEMKLVIPPTPKARPYGLVINSKGVPWFALFGTNRLASIDPDTLEMHEYVLPNPEARPRRITVTPDDVLWYGDFARGYLGRFDPKTGKASEWPSPSGSGSGPYGIAAVKDVIWYSETGVKPNTVVRFDTKTEKFQTWTIPSGGGIIRNMMATPDGNKLWLACSGVNGIAMVEIKSNERAALRP